VGAVVALAAALLSTPMLIRLMRARGLGQPIQDEVTQHAAKSGTPTMGGVVITLGLIVGYAVARFLLHSGPSADGLRLVLVVAAAAGIGFLDDWLKVRRQKNAGGLRPGQKSMLQALMIGGFCASYLLGEHRCTAIALAGCGRVGVQVPSVVWAVFAFAFFWGTCNSVNFADGIEGLLAGQGTITFAALAPIAFWEFRHPGLYHLANGLDVAIVAACLGAACCGFLWWNAIPMTVFMGDVGSLAIGAGVAGVALTLGIPLLIGILGAIYAIEGISAGLQIYTWRWYFKPRGGQRRLFLMAPIHHHFELAGWPESTILVRFWILNGLAAAVAVMVFYADALRAI
jgi:phospho-N-acetylmuramoyl-pentapeptide-transferase